MSTHVPQSQRRNVKVLLVGNSGVGKTLLVSSFYKQMFDFNSKPTVAPAYSYADVKNSKGVSIRLQIWDTAGQERYQSVGQLFFRDSDVALVCFECGAGFKPSLEDVPKWVKMVRDEVPTCELFFVLTKSDLATKDEIEQFKAEAQTVVGRYESQSIFVTSALTKEGVVEVFSAAAELYKPKSTPVDKTDITEQKKDKSGCC